MVEVSSLIFTVWPSTWGDDAKSDTQSSWLRITTRWPGCSSSDRKVRPIAGAMPRVENRFAETRAPRMTRAPAPSILLKRRGTAAKKAKDSKGRIFRSPSKISGYEVLLYILAPELLAGTPL